MRRTVAVLKGSSGRGWYYHYREKPEDFARFTSPTPFDWESTEGMRNPAVRPIAFFTLSSGTEVLGTLEFELARDIMPRTVDNFCRLVTGDSPAGRCYKGTKIHKIAKEVAIMAGDVVNNDGSGSHSAGATRFIKDENFIIPHSERGMLSMASVGVHTTGSQFYVSLSATQFMNGRCAVFGRMLKGDELLARMEKVFTVKRTPVADIVITDCGIIEPK